MPDFGLATYDVQRRWISDSRQEGKSWESIMLGCEDSEEDLRGFLSFQRKYNKWPVFSIADWQELVRHQQNAELRSQILDANKLRAILVDVNQNNEIQEPMDPKSSWQLYKQKISKKIKKESVDDITKSAIDTLRCLSQDTVESGTLKGMVVGSVQSGKTANMAALMAMAADYGWNMFIVLTGTIYNLMLQTLDRLKKDLNNDGSLVWDIFPSNNLDGTIDKKISELHFHESSPMRYLAVCLKQRNWLYDLIRWLAADPNKRKNMKILLIEDEADQGTINTAMDDEERKTISRLACILANGQNVHKERKKDEKGIEKDVFVPEMLDEPYKAINYIGYTATPYANLLNEDKVESLYPRHFIASLASSDEYFGPQQIFGAKDTEFDGLDILNVVKRKNKDSETDDIEKLKEIHDGNSKEITESLKDALCWFLCGAACIRVQGRYKGPVSMLIHTSQKTEHHDNVFKVISKWLSDHESSEIVDECRKVWEVQTKKFTLQNFQQQYSSYGLMGSLVDYPAFADLVPEIELLLKEITHIQLDGDDVPTFHKGIHVCIDNSTHNGIAEGKQRIRLIYPKDDQLEKLEKAPAFIVVGGSTLSRGLTIEGLISTYFMRTTGQADTLLQMGRWFGYRKGYELIPRIWMTKKTIEQYKFLAELDYELRDRIQKFSMMGKKPADCAVCIMNSPKMSFIRITAKNRMQKAVPADMDFTGALNQTTLFKNDDKILEDNIAIVEGFLGSLPAPQRETKRSVVWNDIQFSLIRTNLLEKFHFNERQRVFNDLRPLFAWIEDVTKQKLLSNWNVIVCGKSSNTNGQWNLPNKYGTVNKIVRTKLKSHSELSDILNLKTIKGPSDILEDVDFNSLSEDVKQKIEVYKQRRHDEDEGVLGSYESSIRDLAGFETVPQILIYMIDKDSDLPEGKTSNVREKLDAKADVVGLCINIPGGERSKNHVAHIKIDLTQDLDNKVFDGEADINDADAS